MNGNRLQNGSQEEQVLEIDIDEDSRSPEEMKALMEEYMLPPQKPGIAS